MSLTAWCWRAREEAGDGGPQKQKRLAKGKRNETKI